MPRTKRKKTVADANATPDKGGTVELPKELIDQLLAAAGGGAGLTGPDGLLKKLTAALVNRALDAEMSEHLGYDSGQRPPPEPDNRRNGRRTKQVRTERGDIAVEVPRDRANTIEALNRILRKALKTRGPLPTDEAAMKLPYLAIRNAKETWGRAHRDWLTARMQLAIHFEGRLG